MKYAILRIGGKQYRVQEGQELLVDRLKSDKVEPETLLVVEDDKVKVGVPLVKDARIKFRVVEEVKGEKIEILKYKAKSRYRKSSGFRPKYTKLLIEKIS